MTQSDDTPDRDPISGFDVLRGVIGVFGSNTVSEAVEETRKHVEDEGDATRQARNGVTLGERLAEIRDQMRAAPDNPQAPTMRWREIEEDGNFVGLRLFLSTPPEEAEVYVTNDTVMIETPKGIYKRSVRFEPDPNVRFDRTDDAITEAVIRPRGYDTDPEPIALPAEEAEPEPEPVPDGPTTDAPEPADETDSDESDDPDGLDLDLDPDPLPEMGEGVEDDPNLR